MKLKTACLTLGSLLTTAMLSNAATFILDNSGSGPAGITPGYVGDTIYTNSSNALFSTGFATMGYFTSTVSLADIDTIAELQAQLLIPGNFTSMSSTTDLTGGGFGPGYAVGPTNAGVNTSGLIGRSLYSITTTQASLAAFASGSGSGNQVALVFLRNVISDTPSVQTYVGNPSLPATVVIGARSTINTVGVHALGDGLYNTVTLAAVPEPTTALLGAIGAIALLRRRRN